MEGKFISYVITKALPGALLMLISVLIIEIAKPFLITLYGFDNKIYQAMQIHVMNFAGVITLFRICKPFNTFRGVLFSVVFVVLTGISVYTLAQGMSILNMVAVTPFKTYWHHVLIMVTIIIMDIPLSGWLDSLVSQFKAPQKRKISDNRTNTNGLTICQPFVLLLKNYIEDIVCIYLSDKNFSGLWNLLHNVGLNANKCLSIFSPSVSILYAL